MKSILVTGGCGFIGSNFLVYFVNKYPNLKIINLDLLTYAGNLENTKEIENKENYIFIQGDIRNPNLIQSIFEKYEIEGVIHFAAESHVDNSIENPEIFLQTNILGTFQLLNLAYKHWMQKPFCPKKGKEAARFLHVSTDEVYGSLGESGFFTEKTPYAPNSPYSASKAGSDFIVRSYHHTYGLNTIITNCSNNYGPKQHAEKLIPTILRKALAQHPIPIYGDGKNIRDWLYVLDHCKGVELAFFKGKSGETYNIGGRNERTNNQIAQTICKILDQKRPRSSGSYADLITYVPDRPGHDRRYAIDATKIERELGWKAEENFETGILKTIDWYLEKWDKKD
jgi:dTDP-glucose 4,6-dehydratase